MSCSTVFLSSRNQSTQIPSFTNEHQEQLLICFFKKSIEGWRRLARVFAQDERPLAFGPNIFFFARHTRVSEAHACFFLKKKQKCV
jgi:hypothetical protein